MVSGAMEEPISKKIRAIGVSNFQSDRIIDLMIHQQNNAGCKSD